MSALKRFSIGHWLYSLNFWFGIGIFYFLERGLTTAEAAMLIAVYSGALIVLEYPTGVIADTYGNKKSLVWGLLLLTASFLISVNNLTFGQYVWNMIFGAIGGALVSGSNVALLYNLSESFKKDYAHIESVRLLFAAGAIFTGGFLYKAHIALPFVATSLCCFAAAWIMNGVEENTQKAQREHRSLGEVMQQAGQSVVRSRTLQRLL